MLTYFLNARPRDETNRPDNLLKSEPEIRTTISVRSRNRRDPNGDCLIRNDRRAPNPVVVLEGRQLIGPAVILHARPNHGERPERQGRRVEY